jgi:hypothetical protein
LELRHEKADIVTEDRGETVDQMQPMKIGEGSPRLPAASYHFDPHSLSFIGYIQPHLWNLPMNDTTDDDPGDIGAKPQVDANQAHDFLFYDAGQNRPTNLETSSVR